MSDDPEGVKEVSDQVIQMDYQALTKTHFIRCTMVFKGGSPPQIQECKFTECKFAFQNEAGNTLAFLKALAANEPSKSWLLKLLGILPEP